MEGNEEKYGATSQDLAILRINIVTLSDIHTAFYGELSVSEADVVCVCACVCASGVCVRCVCVLCVYGSVFTPPLLTHTGWDSEHVLPVDGTTATHCCCYALPATAAAATAATAATVVAAAVTD